MQGGAKGPGDFVSFILDLFKTYLRTATQTENLFSKYVCKQNIDAKKLILNLSKFSKSHCNEYIPVLN